MCQELFSVLQTGDKTDKVITPKKHKFQMEGGVGGMNKKISIKYLSE